MAKLLLKIGRNFLIFCEVFIGFLFLYGTIAIYGAIIPTGNLEDNGEMYIYVQSNGVHTDVCLPARSASMNWHDFLPQDDFKRNTSFDFVTIGWGDKGFFLDTPTWADLKLSTALNAAFLPSTTAMHVKYSTEPAETQNRKKVFLSQKNYMKMVRFIQKSFRLKDKKVDLISGKGYSFDDNFYEANESYHLFRTCNRWTNRALKEAKIKTGVFALFPNGIISHLE